MNCFPNTERIKERIFFGWRKGRSRRRRGSGEWWQLSFCGKFTILSGSGCDIRYWSFPFTSNIFSASFFVDGKNHSHRFTWARFEDKGTIFGPENIKFPIYNWIFRGWATRFFSLQTHRLSFHWIQIHIIVFVTLLIVSIGSERGTHREIHIKKAGRVGMGLEE